jgi:hypothetical protein
MVRSAATPRVSNHEAEIAPSIKPHLSRNERINWSLNGFIR